MRFAAKMLGGGFTIPEIPSPATVRLVTQLPDAQVYCIPRDILPDTVRCSGLQACRLDRFSSIAVLKDLASSELFLLPKKSLTLFSVPDEQVGYFVRQLGIRGIKTPYKTKPLHSDPAEVPLHGNVTNPKWASISLGGACNNHCVFCYTDWIRAVPDFQTSQVKDVIARVAEIGTVEALAFSGGEPTLRNDLVLLFEYASKIGFSDIALHTNGRELKNSCLVRELAERRLKRVLLSIHGPNSEVHDEITCSPGSFVDTLEGFGNLGRSQIDVTVNIVMCQANYEHLVDLVVLLNEVFDGHGKLRFSYPIVEGAAFSNLDRVILPFSHLRSPMLAAMQVAREIGLGVEAANMPLCIPDESCHDTIYNTVTLSEFVEASPFYKFNIPRGEKLVKLERCARCSKSGLCRGIQVEYLRAYPNSVDVFKPIV